MAIPFNKQSQKKRKSHPALLWSTAVSHPHMYAHTITNSPYITMFRGESLAAGRNVHSSMSRTARTIAAIPIPFHAKTQSPSAVTSLTQILHASAINISKRKKK